MIPMPMSLQYALDHADDLAKRFEDWESDASRTFDAAPLREVRACLIARAEAEKALIRAVAGARQAGLPWASIAMVLGVSAEAARKKYGDLIKSPPG
jgi:hypothetical protein